MTLIRCLDCGLEQDYEVAVGYCDKCGRKLPVPPPRHKGEPRKLSAASGVVSELSSGNVAATVVVGLVIAIGLAALVVAIVRGNL